MTNTQRSESFAQPADGTRHFGLFVHSLRRRTVACGVAGGVLFAALIGGGAAWASTPSQVASPVVTSSPALSAQPTVALTRAHAHNTKKKHEIVGVVTSINGSTWTVRTHRNTVLTITTSSTTAYGTVKKPTTASSFAIGDRVVVRGHRSGSAVTAKRILHAHAVRRHTASASAGSAA